jgi:hypothetical protein
LEEHCGNKSWSWGSPCRDQRHTDTVTIVLHVHALLQVSLWQSWISQKKVWTSGSLVNCSSTAKCFSNTRLMR